MTEPFLTVYGHVAIDQILSVDKFPDNNTTVDANKKSTHLGGTGTNIAVVAAKLGVPTALCAFVGDDFPKVFEERIASAGVIMDEFYKVKGFDTSQAILINDSAMNQKVIFHQGPQGSASKLGIELLNNANKSQHVHFCTGDPDYYLELMKKIDRPMAVDPAQEIHRLWNREKMLKAMEHCDSVFCNRYEAESLKKYMQIDSMKELNKKLAVCTRGADGSDAFIDGEHFHIPVVVPKKVVDVTGAGDAYRAGYYAGLYHGFDDLEALVIASATSSFIVEERGAMTSAPNWVQVLERAEKYLRAL